MKTLVLLLAIIVFTGAVVVGADEKLSRTAATTAEPNEPSGIGAPRGGVLAESVNLANPTDEPTVNATTGALASTAPAIPTKLQIVTTSNPVVIPLFRDGTKIGNMTLPIGTKLAVVSQSAESVTARHTSGGTVTLSAADIREPLVESVPKIPGEALKPPPEATPTATVPTVVESTPTTNLRTVTAQRVTIFTSDKQLTLYHGSSVEVLTSGENVPEWAAEILITGRSGSDEKWLLPKDWLGDEPPGDDKKPSSKRIPPVSRRLMNQFGEVGTPCFFSVPNGPSFVLMPGARIRVIGRAQTGEEFGHVPGFEIRNDFFSLSAVLPTSYFVGDGAGYQPSPPPVEAALAGNGTAESPFLIRSRKDFDGFRQDPSKWAQGVHTRLETDIDLSETVYDDSVIAPFDPTAGLGSEHKPTFQGVLDGNQKKITGLRISTDLSTKAALIQEIGPEGIVHDLSLEGAIVEIEEINSNAAILCFYNNGLIENCRASGKVTVARGAGSAGLCAQNRESGTILGSFVGGDGETTISGWQAGGLCTLNEGLIERSGASAKIQGHQSGGLISSNQRGIVRNCFAGGRIVDSANVGGLAASNSGTIENCFSRTQLIPVQTDENSISGGLVGRSSGEDAKVTSSFWNTEASGTTQSQGGTGITTAKSKEQNSFPGWDFIDVWTAGTNGPELRSAPETP